MTTTRTPSISAKAISAISTLGTVGGLVCKHTPLIAEFWF